MRFWRALERAVDGAEEESGDAAEAAIIFEMCFDEPKVA
jgi:hypothetical protein